MHTTTATTTTAIQNTRRGAGCQPRLLAHSIPARPSAHSVMPPYIKTLITSLERTGAPSRLASLVSGSSTGSVASLAPGAVAHSPVKAIMASPSADSVTAGSGRESGLPLSARISTPIMASTRPPGIGGSASFVAGAAAGSGAGVTSGGRSAVLQVTRSPQLRASLAAPPARATRAPQSHGPHTGPAVAGS